MPFGRGAQDLQKAAWAQLASPLKEPVLTEAAAHGKGIVLASSDIFSWVSCCTSRRRAAGRVSAVAVFPLHSSVFSPVA